MLQIAVFAVVLVAVYAVKAFAVARKHQELAAQSVSFSWMHPRKEALAVLGNSSARQRRYCRSCVSVSVCFSFSMVFCSFPLMTF